MQIYKNPVDTSMFWKLPGKAPILETKKPLEAREMHPQRQEPMI